MNPWGNARTTNVIPVVCNSFAEDRLHTPTGINADSLGIGHNARISSEVRMRGNVLARIGPKGPVKNQSSSFVPDEQLLMAIGYAVGYGLRMAGFSQNPPTTGSVEVQPSTDAPKPAMKRAGLSVEQVLAEYRTRRSADCTADSVARMMSTLDRFTEWAGWQVVTDCDFGTADAILAARRRGDNGLKWGPTTHDQAVSVLRKFGEYLRRMGHLPVNPFAELEACGEPGGDGARPFTVEQAKAFLAADIDRHMASRRARGCSPLFWYMMFMTGLRYSEAKSITWAAFVEDEHGPWIVTDPKWEGNKSGRKDELPVHPHLWEMLCQHRDRVPHSSNDPVFPKCPNRETWHKTRNMAGIPETDPRFGNATPHSCRKSFGTWLDGMNIPRGLVSALMRHSETLAESRYIRHNPAKSFTAISQLPGIWPIGVEIFSIRRVKTVDGASDSRQDVSATVRDSRMTQQTPQSFKGSPAATHAREPLQVESYGTPAGLPLNGCGVSPEAASTASLTSDSGCRHSMANGQFPTATNDNLNPADPLESEVVHALVNWLNRRGS